MYQYLRKEKAVTANFLYEPVIRVGGGFLGCLFAILYEKTITKLESKRKGEEHSAFEIFIHKVLYISQIPEEKPDN